MGALLREEIAPPLGEMFFCQSACPSLYSKLVGVFSELADLVMGLLGEPYRQLDWGILQTVFTNWN